MFYVSAASAANNLIEITDSKDWVAERYSTQRIREVLDEGIKILGVRVRENGKLGVHVVSRVESAKRFLEKGVSKAKFVFDYVEETDTVILKEITNMIDLYRLEVPWFVSKIADNFWFDRGSCESDDCYFDPGMPEGKVQEIKFTSRVGTNADSLFAGCRFLREVSLELLDVSAATSFNWMFFLCENIIDLDRVFRLGWDTTNIEFCSSMFSGSSLRNPVVSWELLNCRQVQYMFCGCDKMESLTIERATLRKCIDATGFVTSCDKLARICVPVGFLVGTEEPFAADNMFAGNPCLACFDYTELSKTLAVGAKDPNFDRSKVSSDGCYCGDNVYGDAAYDMVLDWHCDGVKYLFGEAGKDEKSSSDGLYILPLIKIHMVTKTEYNSTVSIFADARLAESTAGMLEVVSSNNEKLSFSKMFKGCKCASQGSVNINSSIRDVSSMFAESTIIWVDFDSDIDTSSVVVWDNMFADCVNLERLDLHRFVFNDETMRQIRDGELTYTKMFNNTPKLKQIKVPLSFAVLREYDFFPEKVEIIYCDADGNPANENQITASALDADMFDDTGSGNWEEFD